MSRIEYPYVDDPDSTVFAMGNVGKGEFSIVVFVDDESDFVRIPVMDMVKNLFEDSRQEENLIDNNVLECLQQFQKGLSDYIAEVQRRDDD